MSRYIVWKFLSTAWATAHKVNIILYVLGVSLTYLDKYHFITQEFGLHDDQVYHLFLHIFFPKEEISTVQSATTGNPQWPTIFLPFFWATAEHCNSIAESFPPYKYIRLVSIVVVGMMNTMILICYYNEMDWQRWSINRVLGHRGASQNPGTILQKIFFASHYIRLCTLSATVHNGSQYEKQKFQYTTTSIRKRNAKKCIDKYLRITTRKRLYVFL